MLDTNLAHLCTKVEGIVDGTAVGIPVETGTLLITSMGTEAGMAVHDIITPVEEGIVT